MPSGTIDRDKTPSQKHVAVPKKWKNILETSKTLRKSNFWQLGDALVEKKKKVGYCEYHFLDYEKFLSAESKKNWLQDNNRSLNVASQ